jgi:hypothetical protein
VAEKSALSLLISSALMDGGNLAALTRSHRAVANKKRAKLSEVAEVVFDESAR